MSFITSLFRNSKWGDGRSTLNPAPCGPGPTPLEPDFSNPDNLCDYVINLEARLIRAESLCDQANKLFEKYTEQIQNLQAKNSALETTLKQRNEECVHLETLRMLKKAENGGQTSLDPEIIRSEEQTAVKTLLRLRAQGRRDDVSGARTLDERALLPCMPFVVVLIDGDGYKFHPSLRKGDQEIAGINIAQRLHLAISKHILDNERIPPSSKIIARVFFNGRPWVGEKIPFGKQHTPHQGMMIKFQETHTLFDYIDCGSGKERADSKIHENAHLYIADPNCFAIYLAVCHDNGYARLLEKYQFNPLAQAKIFLVEAGGVVNELERLHAFTRIKLEGLFQDFTFLAKPLIVKPRPKKSDFQKQALQLPQQGLPIVPNPRPALTNRQNGIPPCWKDDKCHARNCWFTHSTPAPALSNGLGMELILATRPPVPNVKSPALLLLEGAVDETRSVRKRREKKGKASKACRLSYLDFVAAQNALPVTVHHAKGGLVPFPFLWDGVLTKSVVEMVGVD